MEGPEGILAAALGALVGLALLLGALSFALRQSRRIRALEERIDRLERGAPSPAVPLAAVPPLAPPTAAPAPPPIPIASAAFPAAGSPLPAAGHPARSLEQLVGGLWLQSVGSVLVLLGSFFSILWGYTTGRIGPGVLVAAGAALGLALAWRGDRMARRLPAFGHALIGVGLGVVYVTFYLGHFTLHALGTRLAFALLALVSLATVATGRRYRSEAVAALGVFGAFLPRLLASALPLHGFALAPLPLLAYLAVVDASVLLLAGWPTPGGQRGWGRLDLAALLLTTVTWLWACAGTPWGWGEQAGLSALFAALGLAAVPRLARAGARAPAAVLAVIVLAPFAHLAASLPFLRHASPHLGGLLLLVMALAWMTAAAWAEPRHAAEDLWRALTAGAVLFVTAAVGRGLGTEQAPMAWCVEALALVGLGLRGRGWLRGCGHVVGFLGAAWLYGRRIEDVGWSAGALPVVYPAGLRDLVSLAALLGIAVLTGRRRAPATPAEPLLGRLWTGGTNLLVMLWSAVESRHVAQALHGTGGHWVRPPSITDLPAHQEMAMLAAVLTSLAWLTQAAALLALGWRQADSFLRWMGLGLFGFTVAKFLLVDLVTVDVFWRFLIAVLVGAVLLAVSYLYQRRARAREAVAAGPTSSPGRGPEA